MRAAEVSVHEVERFVSVIDSVARIVEDETAAIGRSKLDEMERHAERKGQALMALHRGFVPSLAHSATVLDRLQHLRQVLQRNQRTLGVHIDAISAVSQIMVRCLEEVNADGTYAQGFRSSRSF